MHSWQLEKWESDWAIKGLKNVLWYRYYAENAATLLADEDVKTEATKVILPFNPLE
jgi:hypothetical protein